MLSKKFKKILTISMAFSMLFSNNAFATPIDLVNSTENVQTDSLDKTQGTDYFEDETTNEWLNGQILEEVRVTVDLESLFEITIPKEIVLDGKTGQADYKVKAVGDIAGDQKLSVVPDPDFVLSEAGGKADVTAIVTQPDTEYVYTDLQGDGTEYDGSIVATLTAGEWSGRFNFNINFEGEGSVFIPEAGQSLEAYSWDEIAAISEAGLAQDYFNVGDEKKITLNSTSTTGVNTLADEGETYTLQIIGFNHDDLADGSGKAGITFQFKDCIGTYYMNSNGSNSGGWEKCEMRTYINNDIYNSFPNEIKSQIKDIIKNSDDSNNSLISTIDKLFLLSTLEIGDVPNGNPCSLNEGYIYDFFKNTDVGCDIQRIKYLNGVATNWWLRSVRTDNYYGDNVFWNVGSDGCRYAHIYASTNYGVAPAFCI